MINQEETDITICRIRAARTEQGNPNSCSAPPVSTHSSRSIQYSLYSVKLVLSAVSIECLVEGVVQCVFLCLLRLVTGQTLLLPMAVVIGHSAVPLCPRYGLDFSDEELEHIERTKGEGRREGRGRGSGEEERGREEGRQGREEEEEEEEEESCKTEEREDQVKVAV